MNIKISSQDIRKVKLLTEEKIIKNLQKKIIEDKVSSNTGNSVSVFLDAPLINSKLEYATSIAGFVTIFRNVPYYDRNGDIVKPKFEGDYKLRYKTIHSTDHTCIEEILYTYSHNKINKITHESRKIYKINEPEYFEYDETIGSGISKKLNLINNESKTKALRKLAPLFINKITEMDNMFKDMLIIL